MNRDGQGEVGEDRTVTNRAGQGWAIGQGRVEQYQTCWAGQRQAGPDGAKQGGTVTSRAKQDQARPERTGQGLTGPGRARNGQLVPGRARQDRAFCIPGTTVSWALRCACLVSCWSSWQTIAYMWPDRTYQVIPSPSLPCLASTVLSGCVRSCLILISHQPCSALSGAALFHPDLYCLVRPCPALSDAALLYPA